MTQPWNVSSAARAEEHSETRAVVTLEARKAAVGINESYQTANRVESYVATQDLVVPKDALFGKIIEVLMKETAPARRSIRILEPGMGPAAFTRFVLRPPFLERFDDITVQGADISHGMLVYATEVIRALYRTHMNGQRVTIALSSGTNCIHVSDPFYNEIRAQGGRFDAIVASQFEHYCPNHDESPLARKYRELGVPYSTKREFRRLCHDLLESGGAYFTIDDRLGESPEEHEKICQAWDSHVIRQFTNDAVLRQLQVSNPALARNLRLSYDQQRSPQALLHVAPQAREHRREICREEIEPLSVTRRDFVELFGEENVCCMMHPSIETHPGFYLMWAFKKN
jgi:hypothetical protein